MTTFIAAMIATMGDESFVMLAMLPGQALLTPVTERARFFSTNRHMPIMMGSSGPRRRPIHPPMPRPPCPRLIRHRPPADYFKPAGIPLRDLEEVELAADEVEALRLADFEGLYREEAAERMQVSRQTFDRIVRRARAKVAEALVSGHALRIVHQADRTAAGNSATSKPAEQRHEEKPGKRTNRK